MHKPVANLAQPNGSWKRIPHHRLNWKHDPIEERQQKKNHKPHHYRAGATSIIRVIILPIPVPRPPTSVWAGPGLYVCCVFRWCSKSRGLINHFGRSKAADSDIMTKILSIFSPFWAPPSRMLILRHGDAWLLGSFLLSWMSWLWWKQKKNVSIVRRGHRS